MEGIKLATRIHLVKFHEIGKATLNELSAWRKEASTNMREDDVSLIQLGSHAISSDKISVNVEAFVDYIVRENMIAVVEKTTESVLTFFYMHDQIPLQRYAKCSKITNSYRPDMYDNMKIRFETYKNVAFYMPMGFEQNLAELV